MPTTLMLTALVLLAIPTTHAADPHQLPHERLLGLGNELAQRAGSSQWQQLWGNVRQAGYLQARQGHLHFTVAQKQLPQLARATLAKADRVTPLSRSTAVYRRDFSPQLIGLSQGKSVSALCLVVDWRALPHHMVDTPQAYLGAVSLVSTYPCD